MSPRDSSDHAAFARRGSAGLWFALLGGPAAWVVALTVSYFSVHEVCRTQTILAPRLVSLATLIVAVAAALVARGIWTSVDARPSTSPDRPVERTRFLAQIGVLSGAVFGLIIFLQIIATVLLSSCHERPRTPQSPDVRVPARIQIPPSV